MDGEVVKNNGSTCLSPTKLEGSGPQSSFATRWRDRARRFQREAQVLYLIFKHPRTPWYAKGIAAFPVAYLFSPVQLIPNFIPVIGFLDDFVVLLVGARIIQWLTPTDLLRECNEIVDINDLPEKQGVERRIICSAIILTAVSSLLAVLAGSAILAAYFNR